MIILFYFLVKKFFNHGNRKILSNLFLDILITKGTEKFLTNVYRKPLFSGQYLYFVLKNEKKNLIKTLHCWAFMICSPELLHSKTEKIKEILVKNGYSLELIKRVLSYMMKTLGNLNCLDRISFLRFLNYHIWVKFHNYFRRKYKISHNQFTIR